MSRITLPDTSWPGIEHASLLSWQLRYDFPVLTRGDFLTIADIIDEYTYLQSRQAHRQAGQPDTMASREDA